MADAIIYSQVAIQQLTLSFARSMDYIAELPLRLYKAIKPPPRYSSLKGTADATTEDIPSESVANPISRTGQACRYLLAAFIGAAITTSLFAAAPTFQQEPPSGPIIDLTCGHSVEEALANGCQFDMMASTWEAPGCHDAALLAEVLHEGPWQWYRDPANRELVPREEVAQGNFPVEPLYPDSNYHIGHCMYMWRKQHRAYMRGQAISEDLWDYNHTVHCAQLVLREKWPAYGRTQAGFSVCRNEAAWRRYEKS